MGRRVVTREHARTLVQDGWGFVGVTFAERPFVFDPVSVCCLFLFFRLVLCFHTVLPGLSRLGAPPSPLFNLEKITTI